jgi:hypothetical protein
MGNGAAVPKRGHTTATHQWQGSKLHWQHTSQTTQRAIHLRVENAQLCIRRRIAT